MTLANSDEEVKFMFVEGFAHGFLHMYIETLNDNKHELKVYYKNNVVVKSNGVLAKEA